MGVAYSYLYPAPAKEVAPKAEFDLDELKRELGALREELNIANTSQGNYPTLSEVERANMFRKIKALEDENARLNQDLKASREEVLQIRQSQVVEIQTMRDLGRSLEERNQELSQRSQALVQENARLRIASDALQAAVASEREELSKQRRKVEDDARRLKAQLASDLSNVLEPVRRTFEWVCSSGHSVLFNPQNRSPANSMALFTWTLLIKRGDVAALTTAAEHLQLDPNAFNSFETPLLIAIENDAPASVIEALLELGANPNFTKSDQASARTGSAVVRIQGTLLSALRRKRLDLLPLLHANAAKPVFVRVNCPTSTTFLEELVWSTVGRPDDVANIVREVLGLYPKLANTAKESMRYSPDDRVHLAVKTVIKEVQLSNSLESSSSYTGDASPSPLASGLNRTTPDLRSPRVAAPNANSSPKLATTPTVSSAGRTPGPTPSPRGPAMAASSRQLSPGRERSSGPNLMVSSPRTVPAGSAPMLRISRGPVQ